MSFEKDIFEKKGLKIDKDRVLTYSRLSCPLDCRYCFVENLNSEQKKNVAYLSEEQFELLEKLPEEIQIIMLGCDTEFFQNEKQSIETLRKLSDLDRDISVVTKMSLSDGFIKKIKSIDKKLEEKGNFLTFSVSLPCYKSALYWEPKVPSPEKRINTLRSAFKRNIKTLVAIRPLLPTVPYDELEKIVANTKDVCCGYYSGPLYLKELDILEDFKIKDLKIEKLQPHWMPEGNVFYKVEKEGQMEKLKEIIRKSNRPFFEGAAEGIKYLKNHEKH